MTVIFEVASVTRTNYLAIKVVDSTRHTIISHTVPDGIDVRVKYSYSSSQTAHIYVLVIR